MGLRVSTEPYFEKKDHIYYCGIQDEKGNTFVGRARCHPDDQEFESEKIGYTIASRRALIRAIKHHIKNELGPKFKAFKNLYTSMQTSSHFNYKSYEAKRIYKEMMNIEMEIKVFQEMILAIETELKDYISSKDIFHKKIKNLRNQVKNN